MIHFCTFGNEPHYSRSVNELCKEATESQYFDTITPYNQTIIPSEHSKFVQNNARGYGYWIWKPIIILDLMRNTDEGDIIIYADAGCGISTTEAARIQFQEWIRAVKEHPTHRISFQMNYAEEMYTKGDVFEYMDCNTDDYKKSAQHSATIQIYENNAENRDFVEELMKHMCMNNYHYLTDTPSIIPNSKIFKEHRHDQSITSLLLKKRGARVYPDHVNDYLFPIVAIRRKYCEQCICFHYNGDTYY